MRQIPVIFVAVYLILGVLSVNPTFTGEDALSGIFAVVLAAPWTVLIGKLLPGGVGGGVAAGLALVAAGAAINAALIFVVSRLFVRKVSS